jgi:hypothetical protein
LSERPEPTPTDDAPRSAGVARLAICLCGTYLADSVSDPPRPQSVADLWRETTQQRQDERVHTGANQHFNHRVHAREATNSDPYCAGRER